MPEGDYVLVNLSVVAFLQCSARRLCDDIFNR